MRFHHLFLLAIFVSQSPETHAKDYESMATFLDQVRRAPYVSSIYVNGSSDRITGSFDISNEKEIRLIELIEGTLDSNVERTLKNGIPLGRCEDKECGSIEATFFSLEKGRVDIATKVTEETEFQTSEISSLGFNNTLNFDEDNYSLMTSGFANIKGKEIIFDGHADKTMGSNTSVVINNLFYKRSIYDGIINLGYMDVNNTASTGLSSVYLGSGEYVGFSYSNINSENTQKTGSGNSLVLNLNQDSKVLIYRDDKLIASKFLDAGMQKIDVSYFPRGNYPVKIVVQETSGREYELEDMVYNYSSYDQMELGVSAGFMASDSKPYLGVNASDSFFNYLNAGANVSIVDDDVASSVALEANFDNINVYNQTSYQGDWQNRTTISALYDRVNFNVSNSKSWGEYASNTLSASGVITLPRDYSIDVNASKTHGSTTQAINSGVALNKRRLSVFGLDSNLKVGVNYNESDNEEDILYYVNLNFSLPNSDDNLGLHAETRENQGEITKSYGVNYTKNFDNQYIENISVSGDHATSGANSLSASSSLKSRLARGEIYSNWSDDREDRLTYGGSINSSFYVSENKTAFSSNNEQSAVIVDVSGSNDQKDEIVAVVNGSDYTLEKGANVLPLRRDRDNDIRFIHKGGAHLSTNGVSMKGINREVKAVSLEVTDSILVVGTLVDSVSNAPKAGVKVKNHLSETYTDEQGVFVLTVSKVNPTLEINGQISQTLNLENLDESNVLYIGKKSV